MLGILCRSVTGNSVTDHVEYFGVDLKGEWRSCRIVMDHALLDYHRTDVEGNFVLSRDPGTPVIKLNTQSDAGANHV